MKLKQTAILITLSVAISLSSYSASGGDLVKYLLFAASYIVVFVFGTLEAFDKLRSDLRRHAGWTIRAEDDGRVFFDSPVEEPRP